MVLIQNFHALMSLALSLAIAKRSLWRSHCIVDLFLGILMPFSLEPRTYEFDRHERIYVRGNCRCAPDVFCESVEGLADTDKVSPAEERNVAVEIPEQVGHAELPR